VLALTGTGAGLVDCLSNAVAGRNWLGGTASSSIPLNSKIAKADEP
jgi:hypothetical protein